MINHILVSLAAVLLLATACTGDFYDKNTNPDEATDEMLDWDNLRVGASFSQLIKNVLPSYQLSGEEYGSNYFQTIQDLAGNAFAGYSGVTNSGINFNPTYRVSGATHHDNMFDSAYERAIGAWKRVDSERENQPEAAAIADIAKVAVMHRVTDTYGPIPYTNLASNEMTRPYDAQSKVYAAFFEELEAAIDLLYGFSGGSTSTAVLANFDDVLGGNVANWIRFANTLRLRLAMRVAYADPQLARTQAEAAAAHPMGFITSTVQLNKPATGAWEYPMYKIQYDFGDSAAGATILAYMNGYNDPRRAYYFTRNADGDYHGVRSGIDLSQTSNSEYTGSNATLSKFNCTNNDPIVWAKPAEAYFLLAEGALRGWNMGGDAQSFYEQGIAQSFATEGAGSADGYISDSGSTPAPFTDKVNSANSATAPSNITIAWNSGATFEQNLERIITQKYIAIFPDGQEAWSEFRRTGYPKVFPVVYNGNQGQVSTSTQIRRLDFPSSEYSTNGANVQAAVSTLNSESSSASGDNGGTKLWWDKK